MQFKRFYQRTPLTILLIAGMIVAGSVAAYYIYKIQNFGGAAMLKVLTPTNETEGGIEFYNLPLGADGREQIDKVNFGEVEKGREKTKSVMIRNTTNDEIQIGVSGIYFPTDSNRIKCGLSNESGLTYYYGVYSSKNSPYFIGSATPYLITIGAQEEKEVEFFVKFPNQPTEEEDEGLTGVEFEYQFELAKEE